MSGSDDRHGDVEQPDPPPAAEAAAGADPGRAPWLRFALVFGALAVSSEVAYYGLVLDSEFFQAYLRALASAPKS